MKVALMIPIITQKHLIHTSNICYHVEFNKLTSADLKICLHYIAKKYYNDIALPP